MELLSNQMEDTIKANDRNEWTSRTKESFSTKKKHTRTKKLSGA